MNVFSCSYIFTINIPKSQLTPTQKLHRGNYRHKEHELTTTTVSHRANTQNSQTPNTKITVSNREVAQMIGHLEFARQINPTLIQYYTNLHTHLRHYLHQGWERAHSNTDI